MADGRGVPGAACIVLVIRYVTRRRHGDDRSRELCGIARVALAPVLPSQPVQIDLLVVLVSKGCSRKCGSPGGHSNHQAGDLHGGGAEEGACGCRVAEPVEEAWGDERPDENEQREADA